MRQKIECEGKQLWTRLGWKRGSKTRHLQVSVHYGKDKVVTWNWRSVGGSVGRGLQHRAHMRLMLSASEQSADHKKPHSVGWLDDHHGNRRTIRHCHNPAPWQQNNIRDMIAFLFYTWLKRTNLNVISLTISVRNWGKNSVWLHRNIANLSHIQSWILKKLIWKEGKILPWLCPWSLSLESPNLYGSLTWEFPTIVHELLPLILRHEVNYEVRDGKKSSLKLDPILWFFK